MNNITVTKLLDTAAKQVHDHDHDHGSESVDKTEINIAKGVTMLVLFCASMIFGLIPFKLSKWYNWTDPNKDARTNTIVSTLLSFGGGVLLATTFMHLLPGRLHWISSFEVSLSFSKSFIKCMEKCLFFFFTFMGIIYYLIFIRNIRTNC